MMKNLKFKQVLGFYMIMSAKQINTVSGTSL